jgi:hypothetical protein
MAIGDAQKQLQELEQLAGTLGVRVSYDAMTGLSQGGGGLCKVRGEWRIIMDRRLKPVERLQVISEALRSRFDTEAHFVSPQVRSLLAAPISVAAPTSIAAAP